MDAQISSESVCSSSLRFKEAKVLKFPGEGELQELFERVTQAGLTAQPQYVHQEHAAAGVDA